MNAAYGPLKMRMGWDEMGYNGLELARAMVGLGQGLCPRSWSQLAGRGLGGLGWGAYEIEA